MGDHMFTDLALSRDTMKEFLSEKGREHPSQKLSVMVLQQSVWPFSARKHDIDLPPSVGTYLSIMPTICSLSPIDASPIDRLCRVL